MSTTFDYKGMQEQLIEAIKTAQGFTVEALRTVTDTVAPLIADLPKLPFADTITESLPKPEEAVDNSFAFINELLAVQKDFADQLIKALSPLRAPESSEA